MYIVKCFTNYETHYECEAENSAEAIITAHLLAETQGNNCRSNVTKQGEDTHFYSVSGNMDITQRVFS